VRANGRQPSARVGDGDGDGGTVDRAERARAAAGTAVRDQHRLGRGRRVQGCARPAADRPDQAAFIGRAGYYLLKVEGYRAEDRKALALDKCLTQSVPLEYLNTRRGQP
jgi:hypothetical protein